MFSAGVTKRRGPARDAVVRAGWNGNMAEATDSRSGGVDDRRKTKIKTKTRRYVKVSRM